MINFIIDRFELIVFLSFYVPIICITAKRKNYNSLLDRFVLIPIAIITIMIGFALFNKDYTKDEIFYIDYASDNTIVLKLDQTKLNIGDCDKVKFIDSQSRLINRYHYSNDRTFIGMISIDWLDIFQQPYRIIELNKKDIKEVKDDSR